MSIYLEHLPEEVVDAFVFANTPTYLNKHLRRSPYVDQLSREHSQAELMAALDGALEQDLDDVANAAFAYALLTAVLAGKEQPPGRLHLDHARARLPWANHLIALAQERFTPTASFHASTERGAALASDPSRHSPSGSMVSSPGASGASHSGTSRQV